METKMLFLEYYQDSNDDALAGPLWLCFNMHAFLREGALGALGKTGAGLIY
jgi:hypothetical protein